MSATRREGGSSRNLHAHDNRLKEESRDMMQVEGVWAVTYSFLRVLMVEERSKVYK